MSKLGAFGFLSSTEIQQNGAPNAGILDMAFALQWVQNHIHHFGGDKSRVTVAGQSAGAGGVMLLGIAKNGTLATSLFSNVCGSLTTLRSLLTMHQIIAASPYLPPQHRFDASTQHDSMRAFPLALDVRTQPRRYPVCAARIPSHCRPQTQT